MKPSVVTLSLLFIFSRILFFIPHINWRGDVTLMHLTSSPSLADAWAMPGQPPLFQWLVDILGRGWPMFIFYTLLGWVIMVCLFRMLEQKLSPWAAFAWAFLFAIAPATILYERVMLYTYPAMAAMVVALYLISRARTAGEWLLAFTMLALPCWLHSFFHPVFVVGVGLFVLASRPQAKVLVPLLAAVTLASVPMVKNGALYGMWSASSWAPFSLANVATYYTVPTDQRAQYPLATLKPFATPPSAYLSGPITSEGDIDWMQPQAIDAGRVLMPEVTRVIAAHPAYYWQGIQGALYFYLQSPTQGWWSKNRDRLGLYDKAWGFLTTGTDNPNIPVFTTFRRDFNPVSNPMPQSLWAWGHTFGWQNFGFISLLALPLLFVWGCVSAWISRRPHEAAMVAVFGYVTAISLLLELGENMRFKAYIGAILVYWLAGLVQFLKEKR